MAIHSLKLTANAPANGRTPQKEMNLPTIDFQGQSVSFREGIDLYFCTGVKCWTILRRQVQLDRPCTGLVACGFDRGSTENPKPSLGPHMKSEWQKMFDLFCWWCLYTRNLWVCPLFWGFNFNPPKEGWTKLQSKKGSMGFIPVCCISSKTSRFELPQKVVYFFSMPSNEVTTKWSKLKFVCGPRFRWQ